jgi:coenzyme F420-reducing hydrogenase delta subunit
MPFRPAGEVARWRLLYELLETARPGDIVTYEDLGEAIDLDPGTDKGRHAIQMSIRRAAKELLREQLHAVESVPTVGYRVVEPGGQVELARTHQGKAVRALERGHDAVTFLDVTALEPDIRRGVELMARAFLAQRQTMSALDVRQRRLEAALESVSSQSTKTAEQVAELRARLERLEQERGEA